MKEFLIIMLHCLLIQAVFCQDCSTGFTQIQYDYIAEHDLFYGNAPRFDGGNDSLRLNLFKPVGDDNLTRPLIVFVHGGGFYGGHRNDFNELCQWYAQRGYVTATVSYRLGFNKLLFDYPFTYDQQEIVRAVYRGMQDVKGAIRYLKGRASQDSTDVERVAIVGGSAGGFIALSTAYLNLPNEKPAAAGNISPFVLEPRPDLGSIEGLMNLNGFGTDVRAVVNIFGAMLDTNHVQSANDPALFNYHQLGDPVVSCYHQPPYWPVALIADNYPFVFGSCVLNTRFENLGFTPERLQSNFYDGNAHEVHDIVLIDSLIANFLDYQFCEITTAVPESNKPEKRFRFYPNPISSYFNIESKEQLNQVSILDFTGRIVWHNSQIGKSYLIDVSSLPNGQYILKVNFVDGDFGCEQISIIK